MGLKLTSAADYAIRAMIHLACLPEGTQALRDEIARAQKIPTSFMAKILRSLVRAQLLRSSRGVNGGFALARAPHEINLLEVVEAIEGPLRLNECSSNPNECEHGMSCPAAPVWTAVQDSMRQILKSASLEALVSSPRRHGRVTSQIPRVLMLGIGEPWAAKEG